MSLSKKEIDALLQLIGRTKDTEINCERCLTVVSEFAEAKLAGRSISESLLLVEHHLSICDECKQEYEALLRTLDQLEH